MVGGSYCQILTIPYRGRGVVLIDVRGSLLESRFSSQLIWCTFGHLIPIGSNGIKSILKGLL